MVDTTLASIFAGVYDDHAESLTEFETQAFIGRFVGHIPDKHFRMINFYGFLANRVRGQSLAQLWPHHEALARAKIVN